MKQSDLTKKNLKKLKELCKKAIKLKGKEDKYDWACFPGDKEWYHKKYAEAVSESIQAEADILLFLREIGNG
jgi:hypothetical protein